DTSGTSSGNTAFAAKFNVGAPVTVTAPATAGGNVFKRWMLDGVQTDTTASTVITMNNDHDLTAVYEPSTTVSVKVQTNPTGGRFSVDGTSYNSSQTFSWAPNSTHTIAANQATANGTGAQLNWNSWSDGGALSHTVTASSSTTYTANLKQQYLLTLINGDGGVVRPITGFYNAQEPVNCTAQPQTQFSFDGWVGTGVDSYTGSFSNIAIDMTAPVTEQANFSLIDTTVQLSAANYSASETAGVFNVTVNRNGPPNHTDSVSYAVTDGTAKEGRDYVNAQGVVTFGLGETSKTFPILIINNSYVNSAPRTVNIKLVQAQGAFLGNPSAAVMTIADDDKTPGPNPIDDPRSFVQFHYFDFLGRFPDSSGWDFWTNEITSCGSDQTCINAKRVNVSGAFFLSTEFQQTGYEVERIYKVSYGDASATSTFNGSHQLKVPVIRFAEFMSGKEAIGRGVIIGQAGALDLLENNKQDFVRALVRTQRFFDAFPNTLTPAQFVDQLNQNAGNVLTPSERTDAINLFVGTPDSSDIRVRRHALLAVADAPGLISAETNRAFVLTQYYGYLRRNPDDPPDKPGDYTGYDFWLSKLNQFNGDFVGAQMVQAFLNAGEYRQRFGP
ncbi:MAG TPA: Calx-beta domain-containing protein, partial [Pyrinomonadaceae bacterium]|nr:Calx-beta domain-containing protein [Pyrinomonadaceae bacterium]